MMKEAAETLVPKSPASCGSIGSTQRREIPALNAASARSRIASRGLASLGRKPLDAPGTVHAAAAAGIEQAVVQAIRASLPELDRSPGYAVAAPVLRAQRIGEPALELGERIAIGVGFREPGAHVFLTQIGDVHTAILRCEIQRPREIAAFSL